MSEGTKENYRLEKDKFHLIVTVKDGNVNFLNLAPNMTVEVRDYDNIEYAELYCENENDEKYTIQRDILNGGLKPRFLFAHQPRGSPSFNRAGGANPKSGYIVSCLPVHSFSIEYVLLF